MSLYQQLGWDAGQEGQRRKGMVRVIQQATQWLAECTACSRMAYGGNPTEAFWAVARTHREGCREPRA